MLGVVEHLHRNIGHQQTKMTGGAAQTAGSVFDREGAKQEAATEKESVGFSVCLSDLHHVHQCVYTGVRVCVHVILCECTAKKELEVF